MRLRYYRNIFKMKKNCQKELENIPLCGIRVPILNLLTQRIVCVI